MAFEAVMSLDAPSCTALALAGAATAYVFASRRSAPHVPPLHFYFACGGGLCLAAALALCAALGAPRAALGAAALGACVFAGARYYGRPAVGVFLWAPALLLAAAFALPGGGPALWAAGWYIAWALVMAFSVSMIGARAARASARVTPSPAAFRPALASGFAFVPAVGGFAYILACAPPRAPPI